MSPPSLASVSSSVKWVGCRLDQKLSLAQHDCENQPLATTSFGESPSFRRSTNLFLPLKLEFQASRPNSVTAVSPELMEEVLSLPQRAEIECEAKPQKQDSGDSQSRVGRLCCSACQ